MFTFANECTKHDQIIINSALWRSSNCSLDPVYKAVYNAQTKAHIVCIGPNN